jgi:hypothetical protein
MEWQDKYGRGGFYVMTRQTGSAERGQVKSCRDVLRRYRYRPEVTACGPDGEVCGTQTRHLLQRRPVQAPTVIPTRKKSHRLDEVQATNDNQD